MKYFLAALAATIGVLSALIVPAQASTHTPATQRAWHATGQIRPADNPHWCLTSPPKPEKIEPVFAAPCVKGDPWQIWFAWRTNSNVGGINLAAWPDADITQSGKISGPTADWRVKVTSIHAQGNPFLIDYSSYEKGWLLYRVFFPRFFSSTVRFITVPSHLSKGTYVAKWNRGASSDKKSQEWLFPPWHELAQVPQH